jgi:hypothetical protein
MKVLCLLKPSKTPASQRCAAPTMRSIAETLIEQWSRSIPIANWAEGRDAVSMRAFADRAQGLQWIGDEE